MKDLLLIDPPLYPPLRPSLGIACLEAVLRLHSVQYIVRDLNVELYRYAQKEDFIIEHFLKNINFNEIRFMGISIMYLTQITFALKIHEYVKRNFPNVQTMIGGALLIAYPEEAEMFSKVFDYVCVGDGEDFIANIISGHVPHTGISNTYCERSIEITPYYANTNNNYFCSDSLYYQATKGCSWGKCAFCTRLPSIKLGFRRKSKNIIATDLVQLKTQHPKLNKIWFTDEFLNLQVLRDVCSVFLEQPVLHGMQWGSFLRVNNQYTKEFVQQLYQSGYRWCRIGVESMSQRMLDLLNKGTKVEDIINNIDLFYECGVAVTALAMTHLPTQSALEAHYDMLQLRKLEPKCKAVRIMQFGLSKNIRIYENLEAYGLNKQEVDLAIEQNDGRMCWLYNNVPSSTKEGSIQNADFQWEQNNEEW